MSENATTPAWPVILIELKADRTVDIGGVPTPVDPGSDPRDVAMAVAADTARVLGRAVRVQAVEPDGTVYPLIVDVEGNVTQAGAPVPAKQPRRKLGLRRNRSGGGGPARPDNVFTASQPPQPQSWGAPAQSESNPPVPAVPSPLEAPPAHAHFPQSGYGPNAPAAELVEAPHTVAPVPPPAVPEPSPAEPPTVHEYAPSDVPSATPTSRSMEAGEPPPADSVTDGALSWQPHAVPVVEVGPEQPAGGERLSVPSPTAEQEHAIGVIARALDRGEPDQALVVAKTMARTAARSGDSGAALATQEMYAYVALLADRPDLAARLYADAVSAWDPCLVDEDAWRARLVENALLCRMRAEQG